MNKIAISSLTLVAAILIISTLYSLQGIFTLRISAYAVPQQQYQLNNSTTNTTTTTNTMTNKSTNLRSNLKTDLNPTVTIPQISNSAYIDPL